MTRHPHWWLPFVLLLGPSLRAFEQPQKAGETETVLERFKVAKDGDMVLLPVEIQGKRYKFVLDTGSSNTVYDTSFRSLLGKPIKSEKASTVGQEISVSIFRSPKAKLGKLSLPKDSEVVCADIRNLGEVSGDQVDGLLGMDFLRQQIFRIDFDKGEVTFLRSIGPFPGQRVPVKFHWNYPLVMAETPRVRGQIPFLVDTACDIGSGRLEADLFSHLDRLGGVNIDGVCRTLGLSGEQCNRFGWIESLSLEGFQHKKLLFTEGRINVLGIDYWARYVVTFDFPHRAIYLKKGRQFDWPEIWHDRSGLRITRTKGQTLVVSVEKGSPAADAGIKPQDVLLKLDDRHISDFSLKGIYRLLNFETNRCRVLLRRGEKELETQLTFSDDES
jgi:hypothetical protein